MMLLLFCALFLLCLNWPTIAIFYNSLKLHSRRGPAPLTAWQEIEDAEADLFQEHYARRIAFAPVTLEAGPIHTEER